MNIPYAILKEQKSINKNCYEYHQFLAKKLFNSTKKLKSSKTTSQKNQNKYSKKKIYKWLFNQDIKTRIKICSIYNDWFIKILNQLLIYIEYDKIIKFKPKKLYEDLYKMLYNNYNDMENFDYKEYIERNYNPYNEDDFSIFFEGIEPKDETNNKLKFNEFLEKEFLNELRFISLNCYNDTLSLSEQVLNSEPKLQEFFDKFSACKIFSDSITIIKAKPNYNNILNFSIPNWVGELNILSIQQLIIICFEISISAYYQIYLIEKEIPKYDFDSKLDDLFSMKLNIENYLAQESNNEKYKINSIFDINDLIKEINSETNERRYNDHERKIDKVYQIAFSRVKSSFYSDPNIKYQDIANEIFSLKNIFNNNIFEFVNEIIFIEAKHAFKVENILYNIIFQKLSNIISQKSIDEIYMDINKETQKSKKKKKKNKKNKGDKKQENEMQENKEEKKEINEIKEDINSDDNNKNIINNSYDDEDDDNNPFYNDFYNESENSKNLIKDNAVCIEMKNLDKKGKEIKEDEEEEKKEKENQNINENNNEKENDILIKELLMEDEQREKMNKKKKKKNKHKKKNNKNGKNDNNLEEKNEEKEDENIINNNNINIINEKIINNLNINESDKNKEENKSKKKYKEFFLYPVEHKKDKKNKNIITNSDSKINNKNKSDNNIYTKDIIINLDYKKEKDLDFNSKDNVSQTTESDKNDNIINTKTKESKNGESNNDNNYIYSETKESSIIVPGNNSNININDNSLKEKLINSCENKSNKIIDNTKECSKIQNINLNNPTINNYVIIHKDSTETISTISPQNNSKNIFPQLLPSYTYSMPFQQLPNYYLTEKNELFEDLSQEILFHEKNIANNINELKIYREEIYGKLKAFIQNTLNQNNFEIELINYGSHETGLSVEFSDIDILIKFCKKDNININMNHLCINTQQNIEEILALLDNELNIEKDKFNIMQINAIYTASVPVLKIKFNLEKIIPNEIQNKIKENYLYNFDEDILQLNFDFTFQEVEKINDNLNIPSLGIISYIKTSIDIYKEIKPIILILKRYMKINKLNSSFHGGLSSYSLFLLLYSYMKYMASIIIPKKTLGYYLYGFFEFYSNFNFAIFSINPILDYPYIILSELHECGMMLIDPITSLNVAKSTFKIDQIKSVFTKGMIIIRNIIFSNFGKDVYNINNCKNIFLRELFMNQTRILIFKDLIPQIHMQNQKFIGSWK